MQAAIDKLANALRCCLEHMDSSSPMGQYAYEQGLLAMQKAIGDLA